VKTLQGTHILQRSKKTAKNQSSSSKCQLRIIGGSMRGRKIDFIEVDGLRPTLDRIRETLFNWLMGDVQGANCLDLFAGSGALGFEALSRGAQSVHFVDANADVSKQIGQCLQQIDINNCQVHQQTAESFLKRNQQAFDLIFLDPPFERGLLLPTLELLCNNPQHLSPNALIYVEQESQATAIEANEDWQLLKSKKTSRFSYQLLQMRK